MATFQLVGVWTIKIGLFIVPFIPLYVSRILFFPFITGKAFVFRAIVEIILVLWIALALFYKEYRPKMTPLLYALAAFLIVITLASVFGVNFVRSFWSNFERMEGLLMHLHLFAYFLVAGHVLRKKDWIVFFNFFVVAGFGQDIVALFQKLGIIASPQGGARTDGTIGNATYVAAYSIFVFAISLFLFLRTKVTWARVWYGFMVLFTLLAIYFTATRGVVLALFVGALVSGILYLFLSKAKTPREKLYKPIVIGALIVIVVAGGLLKIFKDSSFVKGSDALSRFASISLKEGQTRFLIWNMGWQGFKERPILGWGLENYNIIFAKYYDPGLYAQEPWFDRSHNIVFDWLINAGILGLLAYLGIFAAALSMLWRWYRSMPREHGEKAFALKTAILTSALFFVYLLQNFFVFDQFTTYMGFFSILAYIHAIAIEQKGEGRGGGVAADTGNPLKWAVVGITAIAFVLVAYFVSYKPVVANINLLRGLQTGNISAFDYFTKALVASGPLGRTEAREHLAQFALLVFDSPDVDLEFKEKVFQRTILELKDAEERAPDDPRIMTFLGAVYSRAGANAEAAAAFERAIAISPKKQQLYFQLGEAYIRMDDFTRALAVLERAYELDRRFTQAYLNLIAAYILHGDLERADTMLLEVVGRVNHPDPIIAQAYARTKNYRRLLATWQAFLEEDPDNLTYWKNVAAVHLELGEYREAIRVLEEAIARDPSFAKEGEGYIAAIRAEYLQ